MGSQGERIIKSACKRAGIDNTHACSMMINDLNASLLISEAEFWLNNKEVKVTEENINRLVTACDDAMEAKADDIKEGVED